MKWVLNICNIRGIPIRVHLSFLILLPWIAYLTAGSDTNLITEIIFLLAIFGCVLLHELGHALTALRFGIKTRDIVLYPFGGIASLLGEPKPRGELIIAIAGPLVNFALAFVLFPFLNFPEEAVHFNEIGFFEKLFLANIILGTFNLIPAFPMDGGRILRATLLLLKVPHATVIASRMSQVLSLMLLALALYGNNLILVLVAIFVFMAASREATQVKTTGLAAGLKVKDVMMDLNSFQVFTHGTTVSEALKSALTAIQRYFPVLHGEQVLGVVDRDELIHSAALHGEMDYVSALMRREFSTIRPDQMLNEVVMRISSGEKDPFLVIENDLLIGMVSREKLFEILMYKRSQRH